MSSLKIENSAIIGPLKLLPRRLQTLLHNRSGVLTQDLVQKPGDFGLGNVPARLKPDATTTMVCGFCSTGCGLNIHLKDAQAVNLSPATEYPVNLGMACPKGWEALNVLESDDRAVRPLLRNAAGKLEPVNWLVALNTFCQRMQAIQAEHGADSVAFLSSGQITTEEMLFLGSLTKFGMGIKHGDGNTRQCMATAATAYKQSFGFDSPPFTYQDFEESDVIVLVGSNLCIAHPIMWQRILRNRHNPEIIVVDPRRTETAIAATEHLPIQPKSDLALFYCLANLLIQNKAIDRDFIDAHTCDFDAFAEFVAEYSIERAANATGIDIETIERVAQKIAAGRRVSFWWTMGVNQSYEGTRIAQSLINLALMTGNIGRAGTGANSITGQCNAMGSRLFSNTTNLLGGHSFEDPADRAKIASIMKIEEQQIPTDTGWAYDQIIDGIRSGKIRGLWVIATNTSHSWIHQDDVRELLGKLDFLVVQDMYSTTETALAADLVLPAAAWGEKDGTFINSERRIGVVKRVSRAPGEAIADFYIFKLIAERWGCGEMFADWDSPADVFETMKALSEGQPCDISGITDYKLLDRCGGIQWPFTPEMGKEFSSEMASEMATEMSTGHSVTGISPPAQQRRLFSDGNFYHADGRAKFIFDAPTSTPEQPDDEYPFWLLTGRGTAAQWHTQTRTSKSAVLRSLYPQRAYCEINPLDARQMGIESNDEIQVSSRRGTIRLIAFVTSVVAPGQLFIPMHYEPTNRLTLAHFDPHSRQPSYKDCAVNVVRCRKGVRSNASTSGLASSPTASLAQYSLRDEV
jgi:assimilatory nitrate reductase catalytic subunit